MVNATHTIFLMKRTALARVEDTSQTMSMFLWLLTFRFLTHLFSELISTAVVPGAIAGSNKSFEVRTLRRQSADDFVPFSIVLAPLIICAVPAQATSGPPRVLLNNYRSL